mmetsp:Transcript_62345/g.180746  ORF Transcript_62345/g.180746 Transcript_62345/m.180746 type:complete len:200 (-) Transcript_62345:1262-1861(-)
MLECAVCAPQRTSDPSTLNAADVVRVRLRVRNASRAHQVTGVSEALLAFADPLPPHDLVLRLVEEVQRCLALRPLGLHRSATQEVADEAYEATERPWERKCRIQRRATTLRLPAEDHPVLSSSELGRLLVDQLVQSPLHNMQGLPVDGVLPHTAVVRQIIVPRQKLVQAPTSSTVLQPPRIVATHLPTRRRRHDDLQRN